MIFKKVALVNTDLFILKSDEFEITVGADGVYIEGIGAPDEHLGRLGHYQDLQGFAKALSEAWQELERRQEAKRIQIAKVVPPPPSPLLTMPRSEE